MQKEWQVKWVPIGTIKKDPNNRNKHPKEQIERLTQLMSHYGWVGNPLVVSKESGLLKAGEGRLLSAKKAKLKKVPVHFNQFDTPEDAYGWAISDNAITSWAELELGEINQDLGDLGPDFDINMLGIKDFELEPADKYADKDADSVPEVTKATTKLGDLWLLGDHRVLCGDCTVKANVDRLMQGEKADMVFTDPPYGMNLDADYSDMTDSKTGTKGTKFRSVHGDDGDYDPRLLIKVFDYCKEQFWFGADYYAERLPNKNNGSWVIWDKRSDVETTSENAISIDRRFGSCFETCWSRARHKREFARIMWSGKFVGNTARKHDGIQKHIHPTQKPVALPILFFERWGKDAKLIWDGYLGSGSTLIACEKTDRKCYGMEIDPHYCDVIVKRWEEFTGNKARLQSAKVKR